MKNPWQKLSEEVVYDSPWIKVHHEEVLTPGKTNGIYGWVEFKHIAVGCIPIDEEGNTILVGQYRYPNKEYSWEIPEGGAKKSEAPLEGMKRELQEETGLYAAEYILIQELRLSNSATDEIAYLYLATGLAEAQGIPDDTEELQLKKVPVHKAIEMVLNGIITDAMSVAALLKLNHLLKTNVAIPNTPFGNE
jgi:8-oxo-dGTP pyrophosphatase MutT (NUDIX family)